MDYGARKAGSKPASYQDGYFPMFFLDMISIIGRPLQPITNRSGFFDNVTFSLQHWQAPYSSKHVVNSLPFDLHHRTFRIATGASRELWYIVMHPNQAQAVELPGRQRQRWEKKAPRSGSSLRKDHAEAMAAYIIKNIFQDGELLGEGVEPKWKLNARQSQSISYDKWLTFQTLFMERWGEFVQQHAHDEFWLEHQPAFHTNDHGANIQITVNGPLRELPMETRIRNDQYDEDEDSDSDSNVSARSHRRQIESNDSEGEDEDEEGRFSSIDEEEAAEVAEQEDAQRALYGDGLEHLRSELEKKYNLDHIEQISYAIAADIHCAEARDSGVDGDDEENEEEVGNAICLLSDRSKVAQQYRSKRDFTFYPLGFHPRYGNFSSRQPPRFLDNLCTVMRDNMSVQNDGSDVLSFGFFQAYSNIKRTIRSRADDLLVTKGIATAALTLPPSDAGRNAPTKSRQLRLLRRLRGQLTPEEPELSTPFTRERQRIQAAMTQEQLAFRMEQVVTIRVSHLKRQRRHFFTVLQPIFQLMRFFLKEVRSYTQVMRGFPPTIFPGILCSYAKLFELALGEMDQRFQARGTKGLDIALSESIAVLDRLGHFCFTGDPRVLPNTVLGPLVTMESLKKGAWPFISPDMLDFRESHGKMDVVRWPRTTDKQPILLHVAALAYHYGAVVAANRHSQVWFGQLQDGAIGDVRSAGRFLEEMFCNLWVPQMMLFLTYQFRRQINRGIRSGMDSNERLRRLEGFRAALEVWESCDEPFSLR